MATNKGKSFPAEILAPDEVRSLIQAASGRAPTGIRNRALIVMLYRGGLRISEALDLRLKDIHRQAGTVRVLHGNYARWIGGDRYIEPPRLGPEEVPPDLLARVSEQQSEKSRLTDSFQPQRCGRAVRETAGFLILYQTLRW